MSLLNKLVIGTVQFGVPYGINNEAGKVPTYEVSKILKKAEVNGVSILDTSYAYGDSEIVLGMLLENDNRFKIVSKIPRTNENPESIFNESLHRLKKDKLYGYLIHHFEYFKEKPSIWKDISALKEEGRIQKIGFSLYHPSELEYLFMQEIDFDIVQIPYNILDKTFESYFVKLKERNVEIQVRSVFLQGLFCVPPEKLKKKLMPLKPYLIEMLEFCNRYEISMEALALNSIIHNSHIDGVLIGVDNAVQLQKNINSVWPTLPVEISSFIASLDVKEQNLLNPVNWNS